MFDSTYLILLHFENNQANKQKINNKIQNEIKYHNNPLQNGCHPVTTRILNDTDSVIIDNSIITNNSKKTDKISGLTK